MTDQEYLEQREAYCRHKGQNWAELSELNSDDIYAINSTGQDVKNFHESKLNVLAEDLIKNFVR